MLSDLPDQRVEGILHSLEVHTHTNKRKGYRTVRVLTAAKGGACQLNHGSPDIVLTLLVKKSQSQKKSVQGSLFELQTTGQTVRISAWLHNTRQRDRDSVIWLKTHRGHSNIVVLIWGQGNLAMIHRLWDNRMLLARVAP